MRKEKRDEIVAQALSEISFARAHKQGKIANWQKNENLYYGKKQAVDTSRSNVDIASAKMQEFVLTFISKIDTPLIFKFVKRKDAQLKRVERLNALRTYDADRDFWNIKDLVGKIQMILYGRTIYSYSADSLDGYKPHLENVDVYDFLIDPSAGGVDIERGAYMGRYGVVKYESDLKEGVRNKLYIKTEVDELIETGGNAGESSQEETNKRNRTYSQRISHPEKEMTNKGKFVFWEWHTTYEGKRYYLLLSENGARAIRVVKLEDLFESNLWPFWTYAALIDLTEFWTPGYADFVREIFMAQAVSINQMLDNAEQINKPQKVVDTTVIANLAELKYRKDGYIKAKGDISKAFKIVETPSIQTPIEVYQVLDAIQEKSSGVNANAKGTSDEEKVGIYEGNQANTADRFGFVNKSYSFGYQRFAKLFDCGVREHLTKKIAIDILGPNGIELEEVSRRDIYRKHEEFGTVVEASNAELALSAAETRSQLMFLERNAGNPIQNPKKAYEMAAVKVGFEEEEIRQLLDVSEFGDAELMSEAERDIEAILDGKEVRPNRQANTAYKQRFVDYMQDHEEDIDAELNARLVLYVRSLDQIIMSNMLRKASEQGAAMITPSPSGPGAAPRPPRPLPAANSIPNGEQGY